MQGFTTDKESSEIKSKPATETPQAVQTEITKPTTKAASASDNMPLLDPTASPRSDDTHYGTKRAAVSPSPTRVSQPEDDIDSSIPLVPTIPAELHNQSIGQFMQELFCKEAMRLTLLIDTLNQSEEEKIKLRAQAAFLQKLKDAFFNFCVNNHIPLADVSTIDITTLMNDYMSHPESSLTQGTKVTPAHKPVIQAQFAGETVALDQEQFALIQTEAGQRQFLETIEPAMQCLFSFVNSDENTAAASHSDPQISPVTNAAAASSSGSSTDTATQSTTPILDTQPTENTETARSKLAASQSKQSAVGATPSSSSLFQPQQKRSAESQITANQTKKRRTDKSEVIENPAPGTKI